MQGCSKEPYYGVVMEEMAGAKEVASDACSWLLPPTTET